MTHSPKVSIALATCNGSRHLVPQLESLLAQSMADLEVVVSDDGSSDDTLALLKQHADRDRRIRLLPAGTGRRGINANFLHCFKACHGQWIAPCDQDDVWLPDKLEAMLKACPAGGLAYCDSMFIDNADQPFRGKRARMSDTRPMPDDPPLLGLLLGNSVSGHAVLMPAAFARTLPPVPAGVLYDWWIALVARCRHMPLRHVGQVLVQYRRHQASATTGDRGRDALARKHDTVLRPLRLAAALMPLLAAEDRPAIAAFARAHAHWIGQHIPVRSFAFHWVHRRQLFCHQRHPTLEALRYMAGYRLRQCLRPKRYPAIDPDDAGDLPA